MIPYSTEIQAAVSKILADATVCFEAKLIGETKREGWVCDEWRVSFTNRMRTENFDFFTGIGCRGIEDPCAAGVIYSLILDSSAESEPFTDWCSNYGYDTDSRKALSIYLTCQESAAKLRRVFTHDQISALESALQDY